MKYSRYIALLLITSLLTQGCATRRPALPDQPANMPEQFAEHLPAPQQEFSPLTPWWETFTDPRLNRLIEETRQNNLDIAQAAARLERLLAQAKESGSSLWPAVRIGSQASEDQQQGFTGETRSGSARISAAASYEVDVWGRLAALRNASALEAEASAQDAKALMTTITAQVADIYFTAAELKERAALSGALVSSLEANHALIAKRYGAGLLAATEVYRAEEALISARNSLPTLEAGIASAEHALATLTGRFFSKETELAPSALPDTPPYFSAGMPASLLQNRPDIEAAFLRVNAKDQQLGAAIANRFPTINLNASYGSSSTEFNSFTVSGIFWNFLGDLALPVVDGGRRRAAAEASQAALSEELARYQNTVLQAVREVEDALAGNRAAEQRLGLTEARLRASEAGFLLAEEEYRHGLADYLAFLQAQQNNIKALLEHTSAKRLLLTERISLFRALGGYQPEHAPCPASQNR